MARTRIDPVAVSRAGVADPSESAGDAVNGNVISNTGKTMIKVHNADGSNPHSITFVTPGTVDGQAVADRTVSIAANATRWFGRFQTSVYGSSMGVTVDSAQLKITVFEP